MTTSITLRPNHLRKTFVTAGYVPGPFFSSSKVMEGYKVGFTLMHILVPKSLIDVVRIQTDTDTMYKP